MSTERRLKRLAQALGGGELDRGQGSAYASIKDWLGWWLQPLQVDRFEEMYERCYPEWAERWGEREVERVFEELIAEAEAVIAGDTMSLLTRDRAGKPSTYVHRMPGIDLEDF